MSKIKLIFITITLLFFTSILATELRIITTEEPPTNYLNEYNQISGITTDIINEIKKELKLNTKTEIMTWARAYSIGQTNPNVILYTAAKTKAREDLGFIFLGPITTRKHVLYSLKSNYLKNPSIETIKKQNLIIGAMREDWRAKYFKDLNLKVYEVSNHSQNLEKLLLKRIDLWASSDLEAPFIVNLENKDINTLDEYYVYKTAQSHILFSKDTSEHIIYQWKKAYRKLQTNGFLDAIAQKWSNILNINLQYSKELGFYKN